MKEPPEMEIYTTHQVAKMLGVSLPSVVNWCKQGKIEALRTPGGHRRIPREEIVRFIRARGYAMPRSLLRDGEEVNRIEGGVLVVCADSDFADLVIDYLRLKRAFPVKKAESALVAGVAIGRSRPRVVVWDEGMPGLDISGLSELSEVISSPKIVILTDYVTVDHRADIESRRTYEVLQKPISLTKLAEAIHRNLSDAEEGAPS